MEERPDRISAHPALVALLSLCAVTYAFAQTK